MIQFPNVEYLSLCFGDEMEMNFPLVLPQLKELTIKADCSFDISIKLMEALPTLQSINIIEQIAEDNITLDMLLVYLSIFKGVQSFKFLYLRKNISEDDIRTHCSDEWHVTCVNVGCYNQFTFVPLAAIA